MSASSPLSCGEGPGGEDNNIAMNINPTAAIFFFLIIFSGPSVVAQIPDSLPSATVISTPALREVKLKDPNTGRRFWLGYINNQELFELRKAGFIILKTRRLRSPGKLRSWEVIFKDFIVGIGKEGVRTLAPKRSP